MKKLRLINIEVLSKNSIILIAVEIQGVA